jgi:hypothetical protein
MHLGELYTARADVEDQEAPLAAKGIAKERARELAADQVAERTTAHTF